MFNLSIQGSSVGVKRVALASVVNFTERSKLAKIRASRKNSNFYSAPQNSQDNYISIPYSVEQRIDSIKIAGRVYVLALQPQNLKKGEYALDPTTGQIKVYLYKNIRQGEPIAISSRAIALRDNTVNLASSLATHFLTGDISISRSFNGHPSGSLSFIADSSGISTLRAHYKPNNKITLYGVPFRVNSYSETIGKRTENPYGRYNVTVSLEGWYQNPLDKPIEITAKGISRVSLSRLASSAGVSLHGGNISFQVKKETDEILTLVPSSEISKRASDHACYVVYSESGRVRISRWKSGGKGHFLSDEDILAPITVNRGQDIPYYPTQIDWTGGLEDSSNTEDQKTKIPSIEYEPTKVYQINPSDTSATTPPESVTVLKTLDHNFDMSGETKSQTYSTYEGNTLLKETTITYGFAYTAIDIYNEAFGEMYGEPSSYWKIVESKTVNHIYDEQTGYYLGSSTNGFRLGRFQTESSMETVEYDSEPEYQSLYQFFRIPVVGQEAYTLAQHRDYYKDITVNPEEAFILYEETGRDGKTRKKALRNPNYVESMFVAKSSNYYNSFAYRINPDYEPPIDQDTPSTTPRYITTGEQKLVESRVDILQSSNTLHTEEEFGSSTGNQYSSEDRYVTHEKIHTAQDATYINSLTIDTSSTSSGRPSNANRKEVAYSVQWKEQKPFPSNQNNPSSKKDPNIVHYVYSGSSRGAISGSNSYDVETLGQAIEAAEAAYDINVTFGKSTINLSCFFNPNLVEGDSLYVSWFGEGYSCRINSISHNIKIIGNEQATGMTQVTAGIWARENLNYVSYHKSNKNLKDPENYWNLFMPFYRGKTLGDNLMREVATLKLTMKSRGNF